METTTTNFLSGLKSSVQEYNDSPETKKIRTLTGAFFAFFLFFAKVNIQRASLEAGIVIKHCLASRHV